MSRQEENDSVIPPPGGTDPRIDEMAGHAGRQPETADADTETDAIHTGPPESRPVEPERGTAQRPGGEMAIRERFDQIKSEFLDDPKSAVDHARSLVEEAVDRVMEEIRNELGDHEDTERMRVAIQRYREVLDRITASG